MTLESGGRLRTAGDVRPGPVAGSRRRYDSPLRRQHAAATHERIVAAGSELLHEGSVREWRSLTVRAVAGRAGVNERTVYRHFGNERGLRDAVMHRLEEEVGIDLETMGLEGIAEVAAHILEQISSFPFEPRPPLDPTLSDASRRQRGSLVRAVSAGSDRWSESDRLVAAAVLDVLWSVAAYERLVADWDLDHRRARQGMTWAIRLVTEAVRQGDRPTRTH